MRIPFSLFYGAKTVLPVELKYTVRFEIIIGPNHADELYLKVDLLEGRQDKTHIHMTNHQQMLRWHYNQFFKIRTFHPGDLVLRQIFQ